MTITEGAPIWKLELNIKPFLSPIWSLPSTWSIDSEVYRVLIVLKLLPLIGHAQVRVQPASSTS